jgi:hypothetical protein
MKEKSADAVPVAVIKSKNPENPLCVIIVSNFSVIIPKNTGKKRMKQENRCIMPE